MKDFATQIYGAVRSELKEPFGPDDVKRACSGWAEKTYTVFLGKPAVGNQGGQCFFNVSAGALPKLMKELYA
jgi:hypothetical protein